MGRPTVKWGQVQKYFIKRGYEITGSGGDTIIKAPADNQNLTASRNQVRIGHKCSNHKGDELYDCYVQSLKRAFGVTWQDILKG